MKNLKNQKGQALVEFAIILPILILILMAIMEFGIMLNCYLTIHNSAREGARIAIIGATDAQIRDVIISTSPTLNVNDLSINITPSEGSRKSGDTLQISVDYNYHMISPVISGLLNNIEVLKAQISMRME